MRNWSGGGVGAAASGSREGGRWRWRLRSGGSEGGPANRELRPGVITPSNGPLRVILLAWLGGNTSKLGYLPPFLHLALDELGSLFPIGIVQHLEEGYKCLYYR